VQTEKFIFIGKGKTIGGENCEKTFPTIHRTALSNIGSINVCRNFVGWATIPIHRTALSNSWALNVCNGFVG
jgi:hypothetical protein